MQSVLIIEDELPNVKRLQKMLNTIDSTINIIATLQTVQSSIKWLQSNQQPDIIFMDIRLTDGLSFEIFNHISITVPVIFITAYDEYALKAFEVNGIDYLLKPLEAEKLEKSIRKARSFYGFESNERIIQMMQNIQLKKPIYRSRFLIPYRDTFQLILTQEIAYFTSENRSTFLVMLNAKRLIIDQPLELLEKELDPKSFFRISRQYIISIKSIQKISQSFNGQLKLELNPATTEAILMSREKSTMLKTWLNNPSAND
ncbi:LytTR family DNA-binding domain-containing protein [Pedobacter sp. MC2016-24]|uniref:LytR/AlgR family response regulator transcription factor n=1 Tax=Pedobacter sp. MC2016-24 TaxID=2780090 RepID=UPI0018814C47|nr:LytTR family DNA-binding domain-containing protein [Pedobacter sp. MC2016-24]MBE9601538.1 response regulator transcription factor [Pedobacter sp. MC2016-24]